MDEKELINKIHRAKSMMLKPSIILCAKDADEIRNKTNMFIDSRPSFPVQTKGWINTYLGVPVYLDINLEETKVVVDFE